MPSSESVGKMPVLALQGSELRAAQEAPASGPASNEAFAPAETARETTGFDPSSSFFPQQLPDDAARPKGRRPIAVRAAGIVVLLVFALGFAYHYAHRPRGEPSAERTTTQTSPTAMPVGKSAARAPVADSAKTPAAGRAQSPERPRVRGAATPAQEATTAQRTSRRGPPAEARTNVPPGNPAIPPVTHTKPVATGEVAKVGQPQPPSVAQPEANVRGCSAQADVLGLCQ